MTMADGQKPLPAGLQRGRQTAQHQVPRWRPLASWGRRSLCARSSNGRLGLREGRARIQEFELAALGEYHAEERRDRCRETPLGLGPGPRDSGQADHQRAESHLQLACELAKRSIERIVIESTGGYEQPLYSALSEAGLPVVRVNPWRVRRFADGMGFLAKTEKP